MILIFREEDWTHILSLQNSNFYKLLSEITYIIYFVLLGSAVIFLSANHPVSLGLILILHTLLIRIVTGLTGGRFWFSYILFLVFLGGVLVLFIYITSLASNEKFMLGWGRLGVGLILVSLVFIGLTIYFLPSTYLNDLGRWVIQVPCYQGLGGLVIKLYRVESFKSTALLILYLLYALLVCANIVGKYSGALRNFN